MFASHTYKFLKAAVITGCLFLVGCENNEADVKNLYAKKVGIEEAKNVVITFTTGGKTKAILSSPLMLRVQDTVTYIEFPKTLKVDFYNDSGVVESNMSALYGRYRESQNIVFLRDSVVIKNTKGETLKTDEMYWDRSRTGWEFYTARPVRINTLMQQIYGAYGMEASQDFKQRHIMQTSGQIKIPASQFPL